MIKLNILLDSKEVILLDDLLLSYSDKGPFGFGWKSKEAYALTEKMREHLEERREFYKSELTFKRV